MSSRSFQEYAAALLPEVEAALDRVLPAESEPPERLHAAMRYSVFAGGKRVRPALAVMSGETFGVPRPALLPAAAALECIHTFSLVHDDLPALDDDDLRRGRPTVHRRFDEATAVLAGDALLALGLQTLASDPAEAPADRRARAVALVAEAVGTEGMIGGQMADLEAEERWPEDAGAALESIHDRKTGALLTAAIRLGGLYAGASVPEDDILARIGRRLGLMFQITDDLLDVEGTEERLGKAVRKDAQASKLTYPSLYGVEESRHRLARAREEALALVARLPGGGGLFASFVAFLATRDH